MRFKKATHFLPLLALGLFFTTGAFAQSPDLTVDQTLIQDPPALDASLTDDQAIEANAAKINTQIFNTLIAINNKLSALKATSLAYNYIVPYSRQKAYQDLVVQARTFSTSSGVALKNCILSRPAITYDSYQSDLKACQASAASAWYSDDIQQNYSAQTLIEAMVFRSLSELSALQSYQSSLQTAAMKWGDASRNLATNVSKQELQALANNPAYQCSPALGTLRLDTPSRLNGQDLPTPMQNQPIQDQGQLGTCYANAASAAIEAVTGQANSALDIAIRYSIKSVDDKSEISTGFGGDFCGAVNIANDEGLCDLKDSWLENTPPMKSGDGTFTARVDWDNRIGNTFDALFAILDGRSALSAGDWTLLGDHASTLIPQLMSITGKKPNLLQTAVSHYILIQVDDWIRNKLATDDQKIALKKDLLQFDAQNAEGFLPVKTKYFANEDKSAAAFYTTYAPILTQIVHNRIPDLSLTIVSRDLGSYMRQAFSMMTGKTWVDDLRNQITQFKAVNNAIQTSLQGCSDPTSVVDIASKINAIIMLSQNASSTTPPIDPAAFSKELFESQTAPENDVFLHAVAPRCQDQSNRIRAPKLTCSPHYSKTEVNNTRWLEVKMIQNLIKGRPLGMAYCAEALGGGSLGPVNQTGGCGEHESLLTGIRYNPDTQRCDLLVWNSWGLTKAKTWIDEKDLVNYVQGIQELSPTN